MLKWVEAVWINIFLERPSQDTFCLLYINFYICAAGFYIVSITFILLNYLKSNALSKAQTKYKGQSVFHIVDCCWRVCASQYRECNRVLLLWRVMNYSTASAPAALHSYPWIALLKWPATPHWAASEKRIFFYCNWQKYKCIALSSWKVFTCELFWICTSFSNSVVNCAFFFFFFKKTNRFF